jgi:hypothetical protein
VSGEEGRRKERKKRKREKETRQEKKERFLALLGMTGRGVDETGEMKSGNVVICELPARCRRY